MKVVLINGSPHAKGNTFQALNAIVDELGKQGIESEIIHVGGMKIRGCIACMGCMKSQNKKCVVDEDINPIIEKMASADGIILGSAVHFSGITGTMKSFLDRAFYVSSANGNLFQFKPAAGVCVARRSGAVAALDQLNKYLTISRMIVVSSQYWNVAYGQTPGEVSQDAEGIQTMQVLARNMAYLLKLKEVGKDIPLPESEPRLWTNMIR